jgi:hypothetical protein
LNSRPSCNLILAVTIKSTYILSDTRMFWFHYTRTRYSDMLVAPLAHRPSKRLAGGKE